MKREYGGIFWVHLILIGLAYTSFLWLDWRLILVGVVGLQVYYLVRGGCDLTFAEFGDDKDTTFAWYYLRKIFPRLNQKVTKFFIRIVLPVLLVVVAFYLQGKR